MREVASTNVAAIGYDEASKTLCVEFFGGSRYRYADVPASLYEDLCLAPSVGRYLREHVIIPTTAGRPRHPATRLLPTDAW